MMTVGDLDRAASVGAADAARWARSGGDLLPRPCNDGGNPSDALRTGNRVVIAHIDAPGNGSPVDGVVHYVATYSGDGARLFIAELRAAATGCRDDTWTSMGSVGVGDESIMIRLNMYGGYAGATETFRYVAAFRIGRAVGVLGSLGTTMSSGDPARARHVAQTVASRMSPIA